MFKRLISSALIFGAAALAPPVLAQAQPCMARGLLVQKLTDNYHETMTGGGLKNPQELLEVWTSDRTGSFTVFVTRPNGQSCVVATGRHWNNAIVKPKPDIAS